MLNNCNVSLPQYDRCLTSQKSASTWIAFPAFTQWVLSLFTHPSSIWKYPHDACKNEAPRKPVTVRVLDSLAYKSLRSSTWLFPSMISLRRFKTVLRLLNWTAVRGSWPPRGGSTFLRLSGREGRVILISSTIHQHSHHNTKPHQREKCSNMFALHEVTACIISCPCTLLPQQEFLMLDHLLWLTF